MARLSSSVPFRANQCFCAVRRLLNCQVTIPSTLRTRRSKLPAGPNARGAFPALNDNILRSARLIEARVPALSVSRMRNYHSIPIDQRRT